MFLSSAGAVGAALNFVYAIFLTRYLGANDYGAYSTIFTMLFFAQVLMNFGMQVIISHPDGYLFTAIPVAACLLQYLDGSIDRPGLWMQALVVEPTRFMTDMQRMGIMMAGGTDEMEPK